MNRFIMFIIEDMLSITVGACAWSVTTLILSPGLMDFVLPMLLDDSEEPLG